MLAGDVALAARIERAEARTPAGGTVNVSGGDGVTYYWPSNRIRIDGNIATSGGGLPSVVFAIACPHWQVTAVDAVAKKAAFIQTTAHSIRLPNLRAVHSRVETLSGGFDVVTCRAYASLRDFCESSRHLLKPGGAWMAMKAKPLRVAVKACSLAGMSCADIKRTLARGA